MSNPNEVVIPFDSVRWNILADPIEAEDGVLVKLEWGWTAGMTEKDFENYADDAPRGSDSVCTGLDQAEELRDKLTEIINQHKARHEELRKESDRKMDELYHKLDMDNVLKRAMRKREIVHEACQQIECDCDLENWGSSIDKAVGRHAPNCKITKEVERRFEEEIL